MTFRNVLLECSRVVDRKTKERFPERDFFSSTRTFDMKTKTGKDPSCYIHTINRTAGKTTHYLMLSLEMYMRYGYQTMFLVRSVDEAEGYSNTFEDVLNIYYPDTEISEYVKLKRCAHALSIENNDFAYCVPIKKADTIKKFSPLFTKVGMILLEEYQPLDGKFVRNEVSLVNSIIRSVARGGGEQVRNDCVLILLGNPITLMNPYLISFGINKLYCTGRKYVFTNSCVAEFSINKESSDKILESGFSDLFSTNAENDAGLDFLIRNDDYIEKTPGKARYLCTLIMGKQCYGVRIASNGIVHVGRKYDETCNTVFAFVENDRIGNARIIENRDFTFSFIRDAYKRGKLRVDSDTTKMFLFEILGIDAYANIL